MTSNGCSVLKYILEKHFRPSIIVFDMYVSLEKFIMVLIIIKSIGNENQYGFMIYVSLILNPFDSNAPTHLSSLEPLWL